MRTAAPAWVRPGPYLLAVNTGNEAMYAFDVRGRFLHGYRSGTAIRRALDNEMVAKRTYTATGRGLALWRRITGPEQSLVVATVRHDLAAVRATVAVDYSGSAGMGDRHAEALAWIDRALAWDRESLAADGSRFRELYRQPLGPLPPDRHQTVPLQFTTDLQQFATHAAQVRDILGADPLRREIFLAGTDVVLHPVISLRLQLRVARALFSPVFQDPRGGFAAWVDGGAALAPDPAHWRGLAELGLRRLYVAVYSGSTAVLDRLGVDLTAARVQQWVEQLRAAGLAVGVLVLAGIGGRRSSVLHTEATAALIAALQLDGQDALYILKQDGGTGMPSGLLAAGPATVARQVVAFRRAAYRSSGRPRVFIYSPYELPQWGEGSAALHGRSRVLESAAAFRA